LSGTDDNAKADANAKTLDNAKAVANATLLDLCGRTSGAGDRGGGSSERQQVLPFPTRRARQLSGNADDADTTGNADAAEGLLDLH
jgi:hypothetical protein